MKHAIAFAMLMALLSGAFIYIAYTGMKRGYKLGWCDAHNGQVVFTNGKDYCLINGELTDFPIRD